LQGDAGIALCMQVLEGVNGLAREPICMPPGVLQTAVLLKELAQSDGVVPAVRRVTPKFRKCTPS
jgi:hypothetical protein